MYIHTYIYPAQNAEGVIIFTTKRYGTILQKDMARQKMYYMTT